MRELVRERDVGERHFDVLDRLAAVRRRLLLALVLMKQSDRADEGEVLHVIATRARADVEERELTGETDWQPGAAAAGAARSDARGARMRSRAS